MVHDTPSRKESRDLRKKAKEAAKEARTLAGIFGIETEKLASKAATRAWHLNERANELEDVAKLEDLSVTLETLVRVNKIGERHEYHRWVCYWREGGKVKKTYLGSFNKLTRSEALMKARSLKASALKISDLKGA
jgi:hypothetical protein